MKITYDGITYDNLTVEEAVALTKSFKGVKTEKKIVHASLISLPKKRKAYKHVMKHSLWKPEEIHFLIRNVNLKPSVLARCTELKGRTPQAISCRQSAIRLKDMRNLGGAFKKALAEVSQQAN